MLEYIYNIAINISVVMRNVIKKLMLCTFIYICLSFHIKQHIAMDIAVENENEKKIEVLTLKEEECKGKKIECGSCEEVLGEKDNKYVNDITDLRKMSCCGTVLCKRCLTEFVFTAFTNASLDVKCPNAGFNATSCKNKNIIHITEEFIDQHLNEFHTVAEYKDGKPDQVLYEMIGEFHKVKKINEENAQALKHGAKFCRECSSILKKEAIIGGNKIQCTSNICNDKFYCFKCLYEYCEKEGCNDPSHCHGNCIDSNDVDMYEKFGTDIICTGEEVVVKYVYDSTLGCTVATEKEQAVERNFKENPFYHPKRCPGCGGMFIKDDQCNHIMCMNKFCRKHWCWFCKRDTDSNGNHTCIYEDWISKYHLIGSGGAYGNFDQLTEEQRKDLNEKSKPEDGDLLPWERKENRIEKSQIKKFIDSHKKNESLNNKKKNESLDNKYINNGKNGKEVHNNDEIFDYCCECCSNCF